MHSQNHARKQFSEDSLTFTDIAAAATAPATSGGPAAADPVLIHEGRAARRLADASGLTEIRLREFSPKGIAPANPAVSMGGSTAGPLAGVNVFSSAARGDVDVRQVDPVVGAESRRGGFQ